MEHKVLPFRTVCSFWKTIYNRDSSTFSFYPPPKAFPSTRDYLGSIDYILYGNVSNLAFRSSNLQVIYRIFTTTGGCRTSGIRIDPSDARFTTIHKFIYFDDLV